MKTFTSCFAFAVAALTLLSTVSVASAGRCHHRRHCCCQTQCCQVQPTSDGMQQAAAPAGTTQRFSYEPSADAAAAPVMTGSVAPFPGNSFSRSRDVEQRRQHPGQGFRP